MGKGSREKFWDLDESQISWELEQELTDEGQEREKEREKLLQLINTNFPQIEPNQIVKGKVIAKTDKDVIVSVGFKSESTIPLNEFEDPESLQVGDEVEVFVESVDMENTGALRLSRKRARMVRMWEYLQRAEEEGLVVQGTIVRRTKGGFVVDFEGIEAFLPGSQVDINPIRNYDAFVGKKMEFKVEKINRAQYNVVVSHKSLIEENLREQRRQILEKLEPGLIMEGTVKNITSFGVFIDLGGVDGLIRTQDLSWGRVTDPHQVVQMHQKLNVVVLSLDENKERILLGLKQLQPDPWDSVDEILKVGDIVKGRVVTVTDYGIFIEIQPGIEGLIHLNELSWSQHPKRPSDLFSIGDEVKAVVIYLDKEERKLHLSIKRLTPDPWNKALEKYPVGSRHKGIVRNITHFGIFVELEEGIDGFLHVGDLSWTKKIDHPTDFVRKGQEIEVVVLEINPEERKLRLGHKQLSDDPWEKLEDVFPEGSVQRGIIVKKKDKGAIVELQYGIEGFCPNAYLRTPKGKPALKEGDEADFVVKEFNREFRRIILSHIDTWQKAPEDTEASESEIKTYKKSTSSQKAKFGDLEALAQLRKALSGEVEQADIHASNTSTQSDSES